jgi:hypothetical protein
MPHCPRRDHRAQGRCSRGGGLPATIAAISPSILWRPGQLDIGTKLHQLLSLPFAARPGVDIVLAGTPDRAAYAAHLGIEPPPRQLKFLGLRVGRSVESSRQSRRPHPQPVSMKAPDLGCRGFVAQLSAHFMRGCRRAPLDPHPTPIDGGSLSKIAHST